MRLVLCLGVFMLAACAAEKNPAAGSGQEEKLIEVRDASVTNPSLLSYRKFLLAKPLRGINSSEHYILEARFLADGAKLVLHDHFMGFTKRDGVELSFERRDTDLVVKISTPDRLRFSLGTLADVFANGPAIRLRVESHDGVASGTHVLVWLNDLNLGSTKAVPLETLNESTAVLDSEKLGFVSMASGRGIFAGLELWSVDVTSARRDLPYVAD